MNTILYATDYSENAVSALRWASLLAKKFGSKLIVMHVFDIPIAIASTVSTSYMKKEKRLFAENYTKLKEFCRKYLDDGWENTDISFVVDEDGSIPSGILEKAMKYDADLVILGTKGASATKEFLLGSTTKRMIKSTPCPLLAVPAKCDTVTIKKMVYATDFEQADIFAIQKLVKIAKRFDAEIRVVHITTQKEYAEEEQMEWFKEMLKEKVNYDKLEFDLIFSDAILEKLEWYVEDSEADVLAMLERKDNNFYQKYLQTDMVKKMIKDINIPLLSFNVGGL